MVPPKTFKEKFWVSVVMILLLAISTFWVLNEAPDKTDPATRNIPETTVSNSNAMFSGIKPVTSEDIKAIYPEMAGKPLLIEFRSKYCLDCKRMAPVLEGLFPHYPNMQTRVYDIKTDRKKNRAVFEAFQPSIVPILVFVRFDGTIQNILYGFHPKADLKGELDLLNSAQSQLTNEGIGS